MLISPWQNWVVGLHTWGWWRRTRRGFGVFYLRQVFIKVHPSLIEAARIDGAGELKILWAIILPQCRAAVATLFLITFITNYNSYMWPSLVITTQDLI